MAKFFNDKVYNPKKRMTSIIIIIVAVIGIVVCFILAKQFGATNKCIPQLVVRTSISVEVNSSLPDKSLYFSQLQCVDEKNISINTDKVKLDTIGDYPVVVTINNEDYDSVVKVIDTTIPELKVKRLAVKSGTEYKPEDFIDSCSDNSKKDCKVSFYDAGTDQDGKIIDYSAYKEKGIYEIKLKAQDESKNESVKKTYLYIDVELPTENPTENPDTETPDGITCKYGNLEYDSSYTMTQVVGSEGCALSLDLYHDDVVREGINKIADTETNKIQTQVNGIPDLKSALTVNRTIVAILNKSVIGVVGFSLKIEVTDNEKNVIVSYYLDENNNRIYEKNPYNLE